MIKVKEIKEYLQEEVFIATKFEDKLRRIPTSDLQKIITLINELESENQRLVEERDLYKKQFNELEPIFFDLRDNNKELKSMNETLKFKMNGNLVLENQQLKDLIAK